MYYSSIFQQLFNLIPRYRFEKAVEKTSADRYCKGFTALKQFKTCLYAQISGKDSLRTIEDGLLAEKKRLYHLGMEVVSKSTLADAMNRRSPEIFEAIFNELLERITKLTANHKRRFKNPVYAIDSTTIDLCLSTYNWAHYRKAKGAVKIHVMLELSEEEDVPCFVMVSNGLMSDIRAARENIAIVPDSIYVFDRGYYDLKWFKQINNSSAYFVTRFKSHARIEFLGQHRQVDENPGVLWDEMVRHTAYESAKKYLGPLRLIEFYDETDGENYRFVTNNLELDATSIAEIYKKRWKIEIFFKWIKQNLKIKSFLGTTQNAVKTQIWIAIIYRLLAAYIKFLHGPNLTLTKLVQRIANTLMHNISILEMLNLDSETIKKPPDWNQPEQLELSLKF